jgi:predicted phage terminase large subunit-like protein
MTRWHPDDLVGVLLKREPGGWTVVRYPAIKIGGPTEIDPRPEGVALWEEQHSLERLLKVKKANPHVFQSLYQQDPRPAEGLLFPVESLKYFDMEDIKGRTPDGVISVADVADTGSDYYCMPVALLFGPEIYVVDAVYTQAQAEVTEPLTLAAIERWHIQRARFESNSGGRLYAKSIGEKCTNPYTMIEPVPSTTNKQTRILTASGAVKEHIHFLQHPPQGSDYEKMMSDFTGYLLQGKNEHDDAADAITMLVTAAEEFIQGWSLNY